MAMTTNVGGKHPNKSDYGYMDGPSINVRANSEGQSQGPNTKDDTPPGGNGSSGSPSTTTPK